MDISLEANFITVTSSSQPAHTEMHKVEAMWNAEPSREDSASRDAGRLQWTLIEKRLIHVALGH